VKPKPKAKNYEPYARWSQVKPREVKAKSQKPKAKSQKPSGHANEKF
jgi:hypothetical protein